MLIRDKTKKTSAESTTHIFNKLPIEIESEILTFLSLRDGHRLTRTNHHLASIPKTPLIKETFHRRYPTEYKQLMQDKKNQKIDYKSELLETQKKVYPPRLQALIHAIMDADIDTVDTEINAASFTADSVLIEKLIGTNYRSILELISKYKRQAAFDLVYKKMLDSDDYKKLSEDDRVYVAAMMNQPVNVSCKPTPEELDEKRIEAKPIIPNSDIYITSGSEHKCMTPLRFAASYGNNQFIKSYIEQGGSIHIRQGGGKTALFSAAGRGHCDTIKLLLDNGAKVNAADAWRTTPLITAIHYNRLDAVKLLVEREELILKQNQ